MSLYTHTNYRLDAIRSQAAGINGIASAISSLNKEENNLLLKVVLFSIEDIQNIGLVIRDLGDKLFVETLSSNQMIPLESVIQISRDRYDTSYSCTYNILQEASYHWLSSISIHNLSLGLYRKLINEDNLISEFGPDGEHYYEVIPSWVDSATNKEDFLVGLDHLKSKRKNEIIAYDDLSLRVIKLKCIKLHGKEFFKEWLAKYKSLT